MSNLSDDGRQLVQNLAQRHGLSVDAVTHMLLAVVNGRGTMAQFSHPEFGGSGQWMRGGMTMVSDLFNNQLKNRVDSLCSDISSEMARHQLVPFTGSLQSQSQGGSSAQSQSAGSIGSANSLFVPDPTSQWWPSELGSPSATGSQNNVRYAYFANARRLAVKTGEDVWIYDTLDHQIGGFSQQQGSSGSITFTSQFGTVNLSTLPTISRGRITQPQTAAVPSSTTVPVSPSSTTAHSFTPPVTQSPPNFTPPPVRDNGVLETLERLGGLKDKGYITDEEFATKKAELLSRL